MPAFFITVLIGWGEICWPLFPLIDTEHNRNKTRRKTSIRVHFNSVKAKQFVNSLFTGLNCPSPGLSTCLINSYSDGENFEAFFLRYSFALGDNLCKVRVFTFDAFDGRKLTWKNSFLCLFVFFVTSHRFPIDCKKKEDISYVVFSIINDCWFRKI